MALNLGSDGNLQTSAAQAPPQQQFDHDEDREKAPAYQPGDHIYPWQLGDGVRNTLPTQVLDGWSRVDADRTFEMRQLTIAEQCSAFRLATNDGDTDHRLRTRHSIEFAIRKVGAEDKLSNEFMEEWFEAIGNQGYALLTRQFNVLHMPDMVAQNDFDKSLVKDVQKRLRSMRIPASVVPRKRWEVRTHKACRWVPAVYGKDEKGVDKLTTPGFWTVDGAPVDQVTAVELSRDLSFTMAELKVSTYSQVENIMDDPDDAYATRQMEVMFSLLEIGGRRLGNTGPDLAFKRRWLEDIGPRALLMVVGVFAKAHEVDHGLIASFPDTAVALD